MRPCDLGVAYAAVAYTFDLGNSPVFANRRLGVAYTKWGAWCGPAIRPRCPRRERKHDAGSRGNVSAGEGAQPVGLELRGQCGGSGDGQPKL